MITLSKPSTHDRARTTETHKPTEAVETAGSLAMLYHDGLMTIGQYDEFITNNPFAVDYSQYANYSADGETVAYGGFLANFANAVSVLGGDCGGFASAGFGGDCGGCSCGGGFSSVC